MVPVHLLCVMSLLAQIKGSEKIVALLAGKKIKTTNRVTSGNVNGTKIKKKREVMEKPKGSRFSSKNTINENNLKEDMRLENWETQGEGGRGLGHRASRNM